MGVARSARNRFADDGAEAVVFEPVSSRMATTEEAWARLLSAASGGCPSIKEGAEIDVAEQRGKQLGDPGEAIDRPSGHPAYRVGGELGGPPSEAVAKPIFQAIRLPIPEKFNSGLLKFAPALLRIVFPDRLADQVG